MKIPQKKYKDLEIKVASWQDIEHRYTTDLPGHGWKVEPMIQLIKHIISSGLSKRLFAYTSLDRLIISIYNPIDKNREALHIEFKGHTQKWHFSYHSKPNEPVEFKRQYDADKGIEKFDNFIKMLKW